MTITAKNYFNEIEAILKDMPASAKEAHELLVAMKNDGISDPFNTGDSDIDGMGESLLKEANKILASDSKPAPAKKEPKPKTDKQVKKMINQVSKAEKKIDAAEKKATQTPKKTKVVVAKKPAKVKTVIKRVVKTKIVKVKPAKAPVTVKKLSKELQIIREFAHIDGKSFTPAAIQAKSTKIFNFLPEVKDHKSVIEEIWGKYGMILDHKDVGEATEKITVKLTKEFKDKCLDLVKNASVRIRTEFLSGIGKIITYSDGFKWQVVSEKEALKLFKNNKEVFKLFLDSEAEALVEDELDINANDVYAIEHKHSKKA